MSRSHTLIVSALACLPVLLVAPDAVAVRGPAATVLRAASGSAVHRTVPTAPRRLRTRSASHIAILRWRAPAHDGGAAISGYQVQGGASVASRRTVGATARTARFTGLRNGRRYVLHVRARNSNGFGPWAHAAARPTTPVFNDCFASRRRPRHWQLACADGNGYFDRAAWTHWTGTHATGRARQWFNTCDPDCAAGHYRRFRVHVRLDRARWTGNHTYFKRLRYGRSRLTHTVTLAPRPWVG